MLTISCCPDRSQGLAPWDFVFGRIDHALVCARPPAYFTNWDAAPVGCFSSYQDHGKVYGRPMHVYSPDWLAVTFYSLYRLTMDNPGRHILLTDIEP